MDEQKILIMQYEKLISMYALHHKRWTDHWKTYLTILAILTAILAALITMDDKGIYENIIIIFGSVIGCITSISGWISLNRIMNDSQLTFFHLRKIENEFKSMKLNYIPLFCNGKEFFEKGVFEDLKFRHNFLRKLKLIHFVFLSFLSFIIFYVLIIILIINNSS